MTARVSNGLQYLVVSAQARTATGISAVLHDRTGAYVPGGQLAGASGRSWLTMMDEPGAGELTLPLWHPMATPDLLQYGAQVRMSLDQQQRWVGRIVGLTLTLTEDEHPAVKVEMEELQACLGDVLVYPEGGLGAANRETRLFTHASRLYNTSSWAAAVNVDSYHTSPTWRPINFPEGTGAVRAWSTAPVGGEHEKGYLYFVHEYTTVAADTVVRISAAGNDELDLWNVGAEIAQTRGRGQYASTQQVTMVLPTAGTHRLAGRVRQTGGLGSILYAVERMDAEGEVALQTLAVSGTATKVLAYPAQPPGFTPGAMVRILRDEAQARGYVWPVTLPPDLDTHDTNGVPWQQVVDLPLTVNDTMLDVMDQLLEGDLDAWGLDPGTLQVTMVQDGNVYRDAGTQTRGPVVFRLAHNVVEAELAETRPDATVLLVSTPDGLLEQPRAAAVTAYGRREVPLDLGRATSTTYVSRTIGALLDRLSVPTMDASASVYDTAGHAVYVDWWPGVWVQAPGGWLHGQQVSRRVRGVAVGDGSGDTVTVAPVLTTMEYEQDQLQHRWLSRMAPGAAGGLSARAAPSSSGAGSASTPAGVSTSTAPVVGGHPGTATHVQLGLATTAYVDGAVAGTPNATGQAADLVAVTNGTSGWDLVAKTSLGGGGGGGGGGVFTPIHTFVAGQTADSLATYSFTRPAGAVNGDLLVYAFSSANSTPNTLGPMGDSSWTRLLYYDTSSAEYHAVWVKTLTAAMVGPFTLTNSAGADTAAAMAVYRGVALPVKDSGYVDGALTTPALPVTQALLHLSLFFTTTGTGPLVKTSSYGTADVAVEDTAGNRSRILFVSATPPGVGSTPTVTATGGSSATYDGSWSGTFAA